MGVGGALAGNKPPNLRQHFTKIPSIEIAPQTFGRLGEFQDGDSAAGLENTLNLAEATFVVGEIAKTKGGRDQIKRSAGEREPESIVFKKRHFRFSTLVLRRPLRTHLLFCPAQP